MEHFLLGVAASYVGTLLAAMFVYALMRAHKQERAGLDFDRVTILCGAVPGLAFAAALLVSL